MADLRRGCCCGDQGLLNREGSMDPVPESHGVGHGTGHAQNSELSSAVAPPYGRRYARRVRPGTSFASALDARSDRDFVASPQPCAARGARNMAAEGECSEAGTT